MKQISKTVYKNLSANARGSAYIQALARQDEAELERLLQASDRNGRKAILEIGHAIGTYVLLSLSVEKQMLSHLGSAMQQDAYCQAWERAKGDLNDPEYQRRMAKSIYHTELALKEAAGLIAVRQAACEWCESNGIPPGSLGRAVHITSEDKVIDIGLPPDDETLALMRTSFGGIRLG